MKWMTFLASMMSLFIHFGCSKTSVRGLLPSEVPPVIPSEVFISSVKTRGSHDYIAIFPSVHLDLDLEQPPIGFPSKPDPRILVDRLEISLTRPFDPTDWGLIETRVLWNDLNGVSHDVPFTLNLFGADEGTIELQFANPLDSGRYLLVVDSPFGQNLWPFNILIGDITQDESVISEPALPNPDYDYLNTRCFGRDGLYLLEVGFQCDVNQDLRAGLQDLAFSLVTKTLVGIPYPTP